MNHIERAANAIILMFPDAREKATCSHGYIAIYFIGGNLNGQQWVMRPVALGKRLQVGDESYKLRILKESKAPNLMYPFYVNQQERSE